MFTFSSVRNSKFRSSRLEPTHLLDFAATLYKRLPGTLNRSLEINRESFSMSTSHIVLKAPLRRLLRVEQFRLVVCREHKGTRVQVFVDMLGRRRARNNSAAATERSAQQHGRR